MSKMIKKIDKESIPVIKNIQDVAYAAALETPLSYIMSKDPVSFYSNHKLSIMSTRLLITVGSIFIATGYLLLNPYVTQKFKFAARNYVNEFKQLG
ncbi:MAG: hypothetical protein M3P33_02385 [bacterium]|nr:hypothetical protein [bacterium]